MGERTRRWGERGRGGEPGRLAALWMGLPERGMDE